MDYMNLTCLLATKITVSEELVLALDQLVETKEYPKGHILHPPNNWSRQIFYFEKGLGRLFYFKDEKEVTHVFLQENDFTAQVEPIFYDKEGVYGLELLEKSTISTLAFHKLEEMILDFPELEKLMRIILIEVLLKLSNRLISLQFQSAEERYELMMKQYPSILLRAPLGIVASYLGISQPTLSVIRKQLKVK